MKAKFFPARATVVAIAMAFSTPTLAASIDWISGSGFWENGTNWSSGIAPGPADFATTSAGVDISSEAANTALELFNHARLNVAADMLAVGGTIENNKNNTSASVMTSSGGDAIANRLLNFGGGVVVSDGAGSTLTVGNGGFFNYADGRVRASDAGIINADSFDNEGVLDAVTGGDVNLNAIFNRTGALAEAQGAGSTISVTGAVLNEVGAAFNATEGGALSADSLDNAGTTLALSGGTVGLNSLNNATGGLVEAQGAASTIAVAGAVTNQVFGTVAASVGATLTAESIDNSGRLLAIGDGDIKSNSLANKVGAQTEVDGPGSTIIVAGTASNDALVQISNGGLLGSSDYVQDAGVTRLVNGTLSASNVGFNAGRIEGNGTIIGDTIVNKDAIIAPGLGSDNAGQLNVDGEFNLDGIGQFEIGSLSDFDVIKAGGNATLGATSLLQVSLFGGFAPILGNTFDIIIGSAIFGGFGSSLLPSLTAGLAWNINYLTNVVQLEVVTAPVPLPPSIWMLVSALLGVTAIGRRRASHR
jgi:hypothetical protein